MASLHENTIRKWIKEGTLRTQRAGRVHRIKIEDLEARLAGNGRREHTPGQVDVDALTAKLLAKAGVRKGN
jgi:excisionase family DNA binding protein